MPTTEWAIGHGLGKQKNSEPNFFFLSFLLQAVVLLMGIQRDKALVSWMLENRTKK